MTLDLIYNIIRIEGGDTVGKLKLKTIRAELDLNQKQAADMLGMQQSYYNAIENAYRYLDKIAKFYGVDKRDIMMGNE